MQAITIAIGKLGIDYFARTIVADKATASLNTMTPPDRVIPVDNFSWYEGTARKRVWDIIIRLTRGEMGPTYKMNYGGVVQEETSGHPPGSRFALRFFATDFSESYSWNETYNKSSSSTTNPSTVDHWKKHDNDFDFEPVVAYMKVNPILTFAYDNDLPVPAYTFRVVPDDDSHAMIDVEVSDRAIPKSSILQDQHQTCFSSRVTEATAKMIADVDFTKQIEAIFPPLFESVSASGSLPIGITYDFALAMGVGENGLQFPGAKKGPPGEGITIGVTGAVKWKDQFYEPEPEIPPVPLPVLPVPPVPTAPDDAFMHVYVSNYEISALYWAYFKAGELDRVITPADLPDPDVLKTDTYAPSIEPLDQYYGSAMDAYIKPWKAPVLHCQPVYIFTIDAMATLKKELPAAAYAKMSGCGGNAYESKAILEADLTKRQVNKDCFDAIFKATEQLGLVTKSYLDFKLSIQYVNPQSPGDPYPEIIFKVERTDIMTRLKMGATGFRLTDDSFCRLAASGVPACKLKDLDPMRNHTYISQELFERNAERCLGESSFGELRQIIIDNAEYPVQSLKFEYKNVGYKVSFVSATVPGLAEDLSGPLGWNVWRIACEPQYRATMTKMGELGVPIPIMSGFAFVFDKARITIKQDDPKDDPKDPTAPKIPTAPYIFIAAQVKYRELTPSK